MSARPSQATNEAPQPSGSSPVMKLLFDCPKCGDDCWVETDDLLRGVPCIRCGKRFPVMGGRGFSLRQRVKRTRLRCPLCEQVQTVVLSTAARSAQCAACNQMIDLATTPKTQEPEKTTSLPYSAASNSKPAPTRAESSSTSRRKTRMTSQPSPTWYRIAALVVIASGLLVGFAYLVPSSFGPKSVEQIAADFTHSCLAGDFEATESDYVGEDPIQQAAFERWQIRNFVSIQSKFRPADDRVTIDVRSEGNSGDTCQFTVVMKSQFLGERAVSQCWKQEQGSWQFDAAETMRREDGLSRI